MSDQSQPEQEQKEPTPAEQTAAFETVTTDVPAETKPDDAPAAGTDTAADDKPKEPEKPGAEGDDDGDKHDRKKNRLQKRIDRLTAKARDAERRAEEAERKLQEAGKTGDDTGTSKPAAKGGAEPKPDDFGSYDEYLDALAAFHDDGGKPATEKEAETSKQADDEPAATSDGEVAADDPRYLAALEQLFDSFEGAGKEYKDFDRVVKQPDLKITRTMVMAMNADDVEDPAAIAYYLGTHKDETAAIAAMSPKQQAKEIAKLEGKLSVAAPPVKPKTTKTPDPIAPVGGRGGSTKSLENMDFKEYEATMNAKEAKADFW